MGYYSKGKLDVGNYIWIETDGRIGVGQAYIHSNRLEICNRWTQYDKDGLSRYYDASTLDENYRS